MTGPVEHPETIWLEKEVQRTRETRETLNNYYQCFKMMFGSTLAPFRYLTGMADMIQ